MSDQTWPESLPVRSPRFWMVITLAFALVVALSAWKDTLLSGAAPNFLYYLLVPPFSVLGGVLGMFGLAKLSRLKLAWPEALALVLGVDTLMQLLGILLKLIYYRVWEYPGILYLLILVPATFLGLAYGLGRWCGLRWSEALNLALAAQIGEMVFGLLLSSLPGLSQAG